MKNMKNIITTLCMVILFLASITLTPPQNAEASDVTQLNVDGNWSETFTNPNGGDVLFKFTLPCDGELSYQMMSQAPDHTHVNCYLYDTNLSRISYFTTDGPETKGNSSILSAGTYFLNVSGGKNNAFKLRLNFTPYKLNDQEAISYASPQTISLSQPVYGALTETDREDWYQVIISRSGTYTFSILAETSWFGGHLYRSDLSETLGSINSYTAANLGQASCQLEPGIYYIQIFDQNRTGKYTLTFSPQACTHSYEITKTVKATYFNGGYNLYTCSQCGKTTKKDFVSQLTLSRGNIQSTNGTRRKMSLNWKTISGASGYQVRRSTNKTFKKGVKIVTVKGKNSSKKTLSNLTSGKIYYVQVRAYATKGGKTVYGKWSTTKKVVIK